MKIKAFITSIALLSTPHLVFAQPAIDKAKGLFDKIDQGPDSFGGDLGRAVGSAITLIFSVLGIVALVIIVNAGFHFIFANGDQTRIARTKKQLFWGAIGLLIILASYTLSLYVVDAIEIATIF